MHFYTILFLISEIRAARENQDADILGKYQLIVFKHIFQNLRVTKQVCMQTYLFSYLAFFSHFFGSTTTTLNSLSSVSFQSQPISNRLGSAAHP